MHFDLASMSCTRFAAARTCYADIEFLENGSATAFQRGQGEFFLVIVEYVCRICPRHCVRNGGGPRALLFGGARGPFPAISVRSP